MPRTSAGLLMYRWHEGALQVLLVHPGGPFWARKDRGAWSVPKGEIDSGEDVLAAARREFREETGIEPAPPFLPLGEARQRGGKVVHAYAFAGDCDPRGVKSNTVTIEWPPRSGRRRTFPEIDRAEWFPIAVAREKINAAQVVFLTALERTVEAGPRQS